MTEYSYKFVMHNWRWSYPLSFILFLMLTIPALGRQETNDSIKQFLISAPSDTSKVLTLNDLSRKSWQTGEYIAAKDYANTALQLAKKLNYGTGIASAYNNLGGTYWGLGNYPEALKYYSEQLKTGSAINDQKTIARAYHGIGLIYNEQNKLPEALKNYKKALKIYSETANKKGVAAIYNNIGGIYIKQENYPEALSNYSEALKIRTEINDEFGIAGCYNNIGTIYLQRGNQELKNGDQKKSSAEYSIAMINFSKSLRMKEALDDKQGVSSSCLNIAEIKMNLNQLQEAEKYLLKSLIIAKKIGNMDGIKSTYHSYIRLDTTRRDFTKALEDYKSYVIYHDSLKNEESTQNAFQIQMQYEFEKKESEQIAEQERQDALIAKEKSNQQITLFFVLSVLLLIVLFTVVLLKNFRQIQKISSEVTLQTIIIEEKQKEILDSIHYAKRIQLSLLPSEKYIQKLLKRLK